MPALSELSYSHDEAVRAFHDYYTFLVTMYVKETSVEWPPEGGWPSITPERYAGLGKSIEVLKLLRDIPYLADDAMYSELLPGCTWANWASIPEERIESQDFSDDIICSEGIGMYGERSDPDEGLIPPHVFAITMGGRENDNIFVDTKRGVVFWEDQCPDLFRHTEKFELGQGRIIEQITGLDDDGLEERTEYWPLGPPCWTISDFLELMKHQFLTLRFMALTQDSVRWYDYSEEEEQEGEGKDFAECKSMRDIYRRHGWPPAPLGGQGEYDKAGCLKALKKNAEQNFPDSVTWGSGDEED